MRLSHLLYIAFLWFPQEWVLASTLKQSYVIGGWVPGTQESLRDKWAPIFESYLTEAVGLRHKMPIEFKLVPVDYDEASSATAMYEAGNVDFIYSTPGTLTCLETQHGFAPIATQRQLALGKETGAIGSVMYSLKSNDKIQGLSDFADKRIGVGQTVGVGTFQLGYETLLHNGFHIFAHAAQVVFYGSDYTRQMQDILEGKIDIAFTYSGWLEANHPEEMSKFRFHNVQSLEYQSEPFPFITSTPLVPQFGLASAPGVPWQLRQSIMQALGSLNATHPATAPAGISTFSMPASYVTARTLAEDLGIMVTEHTARRCHSQFENPYDFVKCPDRYEKDSRASAAGAACAADHGLPCPQDLVCLCRPCVPMKPINVFPWEVVLGLCCALFTVSFFLSFGWKTPPDYLYDK